MVLESTQFYNQMLTLSWRVMEKIEGSALEKRQASVRFGLFYLMLVLVFDLQYV